VSGDPGYRLNNDEKYDIQLAQGVLEERRLADIFVGARLELVEVKAESFIWERTGKICIEFSRNGQPSGIAATKAEFWVHVLIRASDREVMGWMMFKTDRLKELCREAYRQRRVLHCVGDGGRSSVVLLRLADLWPMMLGKRG
jgi:hypothetical protein